MTSDTPADTPSWVPFVHRRPIHWGDTDPAGIAYTGRFSDFMLEAIESWCRDRLGTDWYAMAMDRQMGTPFVHMAYDFLSPVTPREGLDIRVLVSKVGRSSTSFALAARGSRTGDLRFTATATNVFVATTAMKPISIPDDFARIIRHEAAMAAPWLAAT